MVLEKIYYINLDHREDRRKEIESVLQRSGVIGISERVSAIKRDIGVIGCVESHILTLEKFISSGLDSALIIEDDLLIIKEEEFSEKISSIDFNFDLIQISGNHMKLIDCDFNGFKKVIDSQTTSGYIVSKEFAPKLLNNFKESLELMKVQGRRHDNCLDIYWKILQPQNKWFAFYPALGIQREGFSDIEKGFVNYGC